jgi:hypothetical protein
MVVIVGAGLTGLTLAETFLDKGIPVTVLERYPTVGGRIVTHREGLQYEIGAGRIFKGHRRVLDLVRRFGLHTYPISDTMEYRLRCSPDKPEALFHEEIFRGIVDFLSTVSPTKLASHTVAELIPPLWQPHLTRFPYRAELYLLRADLALEAFQNEMGTYSGYVGVVEGLDAITSRLAEVVQKKGGILLTRHRVTDIRPTRGGGYEIVGNSGKKAETVPFTLATDQVILATCRCTLGSFSILKKTPVLRYVNTAPLTRIYAVYPRVKGRVWFQGLAKTVTDSPLRFVIPIDERKGLIMISYTDGEDTNAWKHLEGAALKRAIQKEVRGLFGSHIPDPVYLQKHEWSSGCSYWIPGRYSIDTAIQTSMNPAKGLYIVGESVARNQAWMESALESAEQFAKQFLNQKGPGPF